MANRLINLNAVVISGFLLSMQHRRKVAVAQSASQSYRSFAALVD
jgi:hypothetical protein